MENNVWSMLTKFSCRVRNVAQVRGGALTSSFLNGCCFSCCKQLKFFMLFCVWGSSNVMNRGFPAEDNDIVQPWLWRCSLSFAQDPARLKCYNISHWELLQPQSHNKSVPWSIKLQFSCEISTLVLLYTLNSLCGTGTTWFRCSSRVVRAASTSSCSYVLRGRPSMLRILTSSRCNLSTIEARKNKL